MKSTVLRDIPRRLTPVFAAGCFGGLVYCLAAWLFGAAGITTGLGVRLAPHLTPAWLYPRVVWGGLWGLLLLLPVLRDWPLMRAVALGLAPALVQLFLVFPLQTRWGLLGLRLGTLTPLFIVIFNVLWGVGAVAWLQLAEGGALRFSLTAPRRGRSGGGVRALAAARY
jgi:hypothetical protein